MDNPAQADILKGMEHESDILIVGGGLNGPLLALAAARSGLSSTVIDAIPETARAEDGFNGKSYALALASVQLLRNLGVWDRVADDAQPMLDIKVSDGRAGEGPAPFFLHFDHAEIEEGPMGHMLEDRFLRSALLGAMDEEPKIIQVSGDRVVAQEMGNTGVTVTLDSGRSLRGRLLVGADGRGSGTATRAGIRRTGWRYGQTALVAAIEHELPHHGVAHQFFMPSGPLAILPLPGPLSLSIANRFVSDRLALIGDAAHGVHPIAGQGLNAGLRDVAALAQVLHEAAHRGEDIAAADVLERYQQWRRFDTTTLAMTTDMTNRLFSNDNPLLRAVRDLGMGAINHMPGLRRGFIREAAGLTGELPALMKA